MAYVPFTNLPQQFFDNLGNPLVSGTLYAYLAGTSTPTNMFSDNAGTVAGTSVVLDSRGEPTTFKLIWLDSTKNYKFVLKDSTGTTIWTIDNIPAGVNAADVNYTPAGSGAVTTTVQTKLRETKTLYDYGGVADYTGTPQYDGNDASRVTATDNTTAFQNLINAAIAAGHDSVRIPAGHWGIKTGNIAFSNFNKLRIYGDGIGVTILDFFKEDNTGTTYVTDATAQAIASFTTGNSLEFSDMTIKATTKGGIAAGTATPSNYDAVYYGKIWAFKINNVKDVRLNRVRVERFNYRGLSIYGASTERVTMLNCEGLYNSSSGFWVVDADLFEITGGEFSYNGIPGLIGTGYGVTGSGRIGKMISQGAYYHHNYTNGLDTHGCGGLEVIGNIFEENVNRHLSAPNESPPSGISDIQIVIKGNVFSNGADAVGRAFLQAQYQAKFANGFDNADTAGSILSVIDSADGVRLNKISRIVFTDNVVNSHYNWFALTSYGSTTGSVGITMWVRDDGEVIWSNNYLNLVGWQVPTTTSRADKAIPIVIPYGSWRLNGDVIRWPESAAFTNTAYSVITPTSMTWANNIVTVNLPAGHNFQNNEIVTVSGADQAGYNGTFVLTIIGTNVYRYYADNPGAATATGTITLTVQDRSLLVQTNGINVDASNVSLDMNNARFFGTIVSGRRGEAGFSTKNRNFSNCRFSFVDSPFAYIDDIFFAGRQTVGTISCNNNLYSNRNLQNSLPNIDFNRTETNIVYGFALVSKAIGDDVFYLVVDRTWNQIIEISTKDGSADLRIEIPYPELTGISGSAGNSLFEFSAADPFFDDNGIEKIKITVKAKAILSGPYWGRIRVSGSKAGLGVERVVQL